MDLISRRAAIDVCRNPEDGEDAYACGDDIQERLRSLPSAQQWIPVSERLPDGDYRQGYKKQYSMDVLITVINTRDDNTFVDIAYTADGVWQMRNPPDDDPDIPAWCKVLAWMPIEPYKGDGT